MDNKKFYTVTDGMGFMSPDEMNAGYSIATSLSKMYKAKPYSLKKICESNYASKFGRAPIEVTDKMKTYARFNLKNPQHVYVICPEVNSTIESKINMWCNDPERKFKITTIETASMAPRVASYEPVEKVFAPKFVNVKETTDTEGKVVPAEDKPKVIKYFSTVRCADGRKSKHLRKSLVVDTRYDVEISDARRCAIKWGQALGWTFSAPLERGIQFIDADFHTYRHRLSAFGAGSRVQDKVDDPDFEIPAIGTLYMDWWKAKLSKRGDSDSIWFAIQCYKRTPHKEQERDTHYISREELEAHHAKLSPTRHTVGAFQTEFVRLAPESECEEFFKYYKKLRANANKQMWRIDEKNYIYYDTEVHDENGKLTYYSTDGYHFDQCLEPDWAICPKCGTPYKTVDNGESGGICSFCKTELNIMEISRTEQFAVNHALYGDSSSDEN